QIEEYKSSLRLGSNADLLKNDGELMPQFERFVVRRRTVAPKAEEWRELDMEADVRRVLGSSLIPGPEGEGQGLKRVLHPRLGMARPILARGSYPEPNLGLISKSLRVLNEKTGKDPNARILSPLEQKLAEGMNIFTAIPRPDDGVKPKTDKVRPPEEGRKD